MIPASQKEMNQREKDLYYAVLSFLKSVRKAGKTTNVEWNAYKEKLLKIAPSDDMGKAADMWTGKGQLKIYSQSQPELAAFEPLEVGDAYYMLDSHTTDDMEIVMDLR